MSRGARVKREEYDYIKSRTSKGEKVADIAKQLGRSQEVVRNIDYSNDFSDFINTPSKELRARRKREKQKHITVEEICPLENNATEYDPEENKDLPTEYFFSDKIAAILKEACKREMNVNINYSAESKKLSIEGDVMAWASLF